MQISTEPCSMAISSEAVYDLSSGSPIMDAVVRADFEAVRRLAAESSRAGTEKLTPLHAASLNDASQHMVEFLLRAGAPKDIVDGDTGAMSFPWRGGESAIASPGCLSSGWMKSQVLPLRQ